MPLAERLRDLRDLIADLSVFGPQLTDVYDDPPPPLRPPLDPALLEDAERRLGVPLSTLEGTPLPPGIHPYDGCIRLGRGYDGGGYFAFLVITGARRGDAWFSSPHGLKSNGPFLGWFQRFYHGIAGRLLHGAAHDALRERRTSPHDAYLRRWVGCLEREAAPDAGRVAADGDRADDRVEARLRLATVLTYLGQSDEARARQAIAVLDELTAENRRARGAFVHDAALERLYLMASGPAARAASEGAQSRPPRANLVLASPVWRIRRQFAANPSTPPQVLAALVADSQSEVRVAAGRHPHCPADALIRLAAEAERRWDATRGFDSFLELDVVARHPDTPQWTLIELVGLPRRVRDPLASWVSRAAASNAHTPAELLAELAGSELPWLREAVAANPATPAGAVAALAGDGHGLPFGVAGRPRRAVGAGRGRGVPPAGGEQPEPARRAAPPARRRPVGAGPQDGGVPPVRPGRRGRPAGARPGRDGVPAGVEAQRSVRVGADRTARRRATAGGARRPLVRQHPRIGWVTTPVPRDGRCGRPRRAAR